MLPCSVERCGRERQARGLCWRHYQRAKAHGQLPPHMKPSPLPPVTLSNSERHYLAGIFDGEGTVCIFRVQRPTKRRPTATYNLRVGVVMTHEATVRRFHELFGGSFGFDRRRPKIKYKWHCSSRLALRCLSELPLKVKAPNVEIASAFMATHLHENRGRNPVAQSVVSDRLRLVDAMGALNDSHWHAKRRASS